MPGTPPARWHTKAILLTALAVISLFLLPALPLVSRKAPAPVPPPSRPATADGNLVTKSSSAAPPGTPTQAPVPVASERPETLYQLARTHLAAERFLAAREVAQRLSEHSEWHDRAELLLGKIDLELEDVEGAVARWRPVLARNPGAFGSLTGISVSAKDVARALLRTGRPDEASPLLRTMLGRGADREASWLLSRAGLQQGAIPEAQAATAFAEENPTWHEPAPLAGAASCAPCHAEKYRTQQSSRHARTFHRTSRLPDLKPPANPVPDPGNPLVTHQFRHADAGYLQTTRTSERVYEAVFAYAFGSGDRGLTVVGRDDSGQSVELRLSLFREKDPDPIWDLTSGHALHPTSDSAYLGRPLDADDLRRCFSCHVTSPRQVQEGTGPASGDRSIGCETCHGPGTNHLLAVKGKSADLAISRPSLATGSRIVQICARCHSPRGKKVEPDDATSVRFQGTTFTWSRCYTESQDRFDCVTCHDPHRNVETDARVYENRCLACHGAGAPPDGKAARAAIRGLDNHRPRAAACPVNAQEDCIGCHMPKIEEGAPHSTFTDHFIRVHPQQTTNRKG